MISKSKDRVEAALADDFTRVSNLFKGNAGLYLAAFPVQDIKALVVKPAEFSPMYFNPGTTNLSLNLTVISGT